MILKQHIWDAFHFIMLNGIWSTFGALVSKLARNFKAPVAEIKRIEIWDSGTLATMYIY